MAPSKIMPNIVYHKYNYLYYSTDAHKADMSISNIFGSLAYDYNCIIMLTYTLMTSIPIPSKMVNYFSIGTTTIP